MKAYLYNPVTGEYLKTRPAQKSPLEKDVYLLPANATFTAPPTTKKNQSAVFKNKKWSIVPDFRREAYYDKITKTISIINEFGAIPENLTKKKPGKFDKWSGTEWIVDADKKQDVIAILTARIETETENEILNGFEFAGKKFLLSDKNKFEYKAEFDIREHLTYPHRVKCVDGFYDVANTEEHQAWYMSGLAFVRTCTETSWNEIDDLQNKTTQELIVILNT